MAHDPSSALSIALVRTWTGIPEVSPRWLVANSQGTRIVDVREPAEFADGHVPGAELVPLGTLETATRDWQRAAPLVVVCRSGARSGKAARVLERLGFEAVASLRGGVVAWGAEGFPLERPDGLAGTR